MMYWTTTGLIESIKKRDDGMWDYPNIAKMKSLWGQGLGDFVNGRMPLQPNDAMAGGQQRRKFFPNIVMIDFADERSARKIRELNDLAAAALGRRRLTTCIALVVSSAASWPRSSRARTLLRAGFRRRPDERSTARGEDGSLGL